MSGIGGSRWIKHGKSSFMKIFVTVKTGKRANKVERVSDSAYIVEVTARPEHGKANDAVVGALAEYFDIAISHIRIVSGMTAKRKIVAINS